jgi:hypothetical protein
MEISSVKETPMALQLSQDVLGGNFTGNYWVLIETNINFYQRYCHVTLGLFKNVDSFNLGLPPIDTKSFSWQGTDFPFTDNVLNTSLQSIAYQKIQESKKDLNGKESNSFTGAIPL